MTKGDTFASDPQSYEDEKMHKPLMCFNTAVYKNGVQENSTKPWNRTAPVRRKAKSIGSEAYASESASRDVYGLSDMSRRRVFPLLSQVQYTKRRQLMAKETVYRILVVACVVGLILHCTINIIGSTTLPKARRGSRRAKEPTQLLRSGSMYSYYDSKVKLLAPPVLPKPKKKTTRFRYDPSATLAVYDCGVDQYTCPEPSAVNSGGSAAAHLSENFKKFGQILQNYVVDPLKMGGW